MRRSTWIVTVEAVGLALAAFAIWATLALMGGCRPAPVPTGPTCADACDNGRRLYQAGDAACSWSAGVPSSGASCEVVCENAAANGNSWQLDCLARADHCGPTVCP